MYLNQKKRTKQITMNLNFIQDNHLVHVQTQNIIAYKQQVILKEKLLKQDYQDYVQVNSKLTKINSLFGEIVKDLYQHVVNLKVREAGLGEKETGANFVTSGHVDLIRKKKKISIPYRTLKKLQFLKHMFIQCQKTIQTQNRFYLKCNINSENEKQSQARFYKQVLTSYQNKRQYYKKQTLKFEDKVQKVETEVLSNNENNQFTDLTSKVLQFEFILKYEKKLAALQRVNNELKLLTQTRKRIYDQLKKQNPHIQQLKSYQKRQKIAYAKNYLKSIVETERKINVLKINKNQILGREIGKLHEKVEKLKLTNESLKRAIQQGDSEKFFLELQNKVDTKSYFQQKMKSCKVTKTDYIIYLKEMHSKVKHYFKNKEIVYRYWLVSDGMSSTRSRSVGYKV